MHKMNGKDYKRLTLRELVLIPDKAALEAIPEGNVLIDTINPHSFVTAQTDEIFTRALRSADYLRGHKVTLAE